MIDSKYNWNLISFNFDKSKFDLLLKKTKLSPLILKILIQRGYETEDSIKDFLRPSGKNINNPFLLFDMKKTIDRIKKAIYCKEKIVLYGDYDADGITGTALMYEALNNLGANVSYFIPNRFNDGYGPNMQRYKELKKQGIQLMITIDNGISGYNEVNYLQENGIDVIILDHHSLPSVLPPAYAIIHPNHPLGKYPFKKLSGVGVSFKTVCALLNRFSSEFLDLVAIGTIADLVPLVQENRDLVAYGLNILKNTNRMGLKFIFKISNIMPSMIDSDSIGYLIAPRLNSFGRLSNARLGVELLTTLNEQRAYELSLLSEKLNNDRKQLVYDITKEAESILSQQNNHLVNIIVGHKWHEGVLGIVASHLVEKTGKPTLVLSKTDNNVFKGSGRSIKKFQMFNAFNKHRDLFISFGGHAMACGLSINKENLKLFQKIADDEAKLQGLDISKKEILQIEDKININNIDVDLINSLEKLSPFGNGNSNPLFLVYGIKNYSLKIMGKNNQHFKINSNDNTLLDALKFNSLSDIKKLRLNSNDYMEIVGELGKNVWHGKITIPLKIKDFRTFTRINNKNIAIEKINRLTKNIFDNDAVYGFFNSDLRDNVVKYIGHDIKTVLLPSKRLECNKLIIIDCPPSIENLKELSLYGIENIIFKCYVYNDMGLYHLPSRKDFVKLYKFIYSHNKFNLNNNLTRLSNFLELDSKNLIFMLRVFFDLGFVKINNGILINIPQSNNTHVDLTKSKYFKSRIDSMKAQKLFIYQDAMNIFKWLHINIL